MSCSNSRRVDGGASRSLAGRPDECSRRSSTVAEARSGPIHSEKNSATGVSALTAWLIISCRITLVVAIGFVSDARSKIALSGVGAAVGSNANVPKASRQSTRSWLPTSTTADGKTRSATDCCRSTRAAAIGSSSDIRVVRSVRPPPRQALRRNGPLPSAISIEASPMHVLGIDAGGTKTVCLLADEPGAILSVARGPGANLQVAGELEVEKVLHHVMETALDGQEVRPRAVCLGIAGVDREADSRIVSAIMRRITPGTRVLVVNDALVALEAGAPGAPGIVIICGTGSIAYGRNARGVAARAGGWGHIIGDEGSGYWIGKEAVRAVMREADGRGPATVLSQHVLAHFDVPAASSLVHIVYGSHSVSRSIAMLGPSVQMASESGDEVASSILDRAATELALAAKSVTERLQLQDESFPFVLAGGVFRVVPLLLEHVRQRLLDLAPGATVDILRDEPARGAVRLALLEAQGGAPVPKYT